MVGPGGHPVLGRPDGGLRHRRRGPLEAPELRRRRGVAGRGRVHAPRGQAPGEQGRGEPALPDPPKPGGRRAPPGPPGVRRGCRVPARPPRREHAAPLAGLRGDGVQPRHERHPLGTAVRRRQHLHPGLRAALRQRDAPGDGDRPEAGHRLGLPVSLRRRRHLGPPPRGRPERDPPGLAPRGPGPGRRLQDRLPPGGVRHAPGAPLPRGPAPLDPSVALHPRQRGPGRHRREQHGLPPRRAQPGRRTRAGSGRGSRPGAGCPTTTAAGTWTR